MVGHEKEVAGLIDAEIPAPKDLRLGMVILVSVCGVVVLLPLLYVLGASTTPGIVIGFAVGGTLTYILVAVVRKPMRSQQQRTIDEFAKEGRLEACASYVAEQIAVSRAETVARSAVRALVEAKRFGAALRIRMRGTQAPATEPPIDFSFPPISLDEADSGFVRFEEGIAGAVSNSDPPVCRDEEEWSFIRRARRNLAIRIVAPKLFLCMLLYNLARLSWSSIRSGQVEPMLFVFVLVFLVLLGASTSGLLSDLHWFILPGGLVLRRPAKDPASSKLVLFDRRESVLCVVQQRKHAWTVLVSNGQTVESMVATTREANMLLCAWLSPLAPPPVEKLVDLT